MHRKQEVERTNNEILLARKISTIKRFTLAIDLNEKIECIAHTFFCLS